MRIELDGVAQFVDRLLDASEEIPIQSTSHGSHGLASGIPHLFAVVLEKAAVLGTVLVFRFRRGGEFRCCRSRVGKFTDSREHLPPMPEQEVPCPRDLVNSVSRICSQHCIANVTIWLPSCNCCVTVSFVCLDQFLCLCALSRTSYGCVQLSVSLRTPPWRAEAAPIRGAAFPGVL